MSSSANDMIGTQLSLSQTNIISQSEVEGGRSWKNVLQPRFMLHRYPCRDVTEESRMESKFMKPGEDAILIDKGFQINGAGWG